MPTICAYGKVCSDMHNVYHSPDICNFPSLNIRTGAASYKVLPERQRQQPPILHKSCRSVLTWWVLMQDQLSTPKTKTLVQALERWGVNQEEYGLLILNEQSPSIELSARNVEKLKLNTVDHLNVYDVLRADKIVVEESAFKYIQEFYGASSQDASPEEASAEAA